MLHQPAHFIAQQLFSKKDKLLIAFSGGADSVVLAHLLATAGFSIALAHCNFGLRGKESDGDEAFCKTFAKKIKADFFCRRFDTKLFAKQHKLSIQVAARQLRYNWFEELLKNKGFDYLLTAHHAGDNTETLLINLVRGTGIRGLTGIPQKQQSIVRPLLEATKEEILLYAKKHSLKFRSDSSNEDTKYKRNFIRHEVIPKLRQLNPSLEATFGNNIKLFGQGAAIVNEFAAAKRKELVQEKKGATRIHLTKLLKEPHRELLLHEFLYPFGFNGAQTGDLLKSITAGQTGKLFFSKDHQALIDRNRLVITPVRDEQKSEYTINCFEDLMQLPFRIRCGETTRLTFPKNEDSALLDADKLRLPWTIRQWQSGDKFRPLGMKGFKKLSDFFADNKLSRFEKEQTWLLLSGNQVAWIIGHRIDDRFRVTEGTRRAIALKLLP